MGWMPLDPQGRAMLELGPAAVGEKIEGAKIREITPQEQAQREAAERQGAERSRQAMKKLEALTGSNLTGNYAKGGSVYKNSRFTKFNKTGDSRLLAKGMHK